MDISITPSVDKVMFDSLYESTSFREFCSDLDQLGSLFDETLYLDEKVEQGTTGYRRTAGKIYSNTVDSVKAASDIYKYSTDAGGGFFAALWKLAASAAKLVARATKWIFINIDKIPLYASKMIDRIADIPADIKNKIRGNIKLYITADDIVNVYSIPTTKDKNDSALFARLERVIRELKELRQGDMWTTYWTKKTSPAEFFKELAKEFVEGKHKTDMTRIDNINSEFVKIKNVKFSQTTIEMNDPNIVEIYFGTGKIHYTDPRGVKKEGTYLEALKGILDYIAGIKTELKELNDDIGNKFVTTETNAEFANMGKHAQKTIVKFMETMSKLTEIIGNITRYAMEDIKTIEKNVNQIKAASTMSKAGKLEEDSGDNEEEAEEKKKRREQAAEYYAKHPIKKLVQVKKDKKFEKLEQQRKEALGDDDFKMVYHFGRSDIKDMDDKMLDAMKTNMTVNIETAKNKYNDAWNSEDWISIPSASDKDGYPCMVKDYVRSCDRVIKMIDGEKKWRKNGKG